MNRARGYWRYNRKLLPAMPTILADLNPYPTFDRVAH
jgi:hypothetical protein